MSDFTINGASMGPQGTDPDIYAKKYADEKGITLEQAKAELKAQYGDPQPPGMSKNEGLLKFSGENANFSVNPYGTITDDPEKLEAYIKNGAARAGCTPQEFAEMMGIKPKSTKPADTSKTISTETDATEADTPERLSKKDKKEWIKQYQVEHNCSKKEAKEAFKQEYEYDVMSHKEAIKWCKDYMAQNGCTKKEAKKAFEKQHGYPVPLNNFARFGRTAAIALVGFPTMLAAGVATGGVGFFATGALVGTGGILSLKNDNTEGLIYQKRT